MSVFVASVVGAAWALGGTSSGLRPASTSPGATLSPFAGVTCSVTIAGENVANNAIQTALNLASNGSTLCISAGTYPEQLTLNDTNHISLVGAGNASTFIDPAAVGGNGWDSNPVLNLPIYAILGAWNDSYLNVSGLTFDGSGALASVVNNCAAQFTGIYLGNSTANVTAVTVSGISSDGGCQGQNAIFSDIGQGSTTQVWDQAVQVVNSSLIGFGKNGVTCWAVGLTCSLFGNTISTSPMASGFAATNGVVFFDVTGSIRNNTVTGNVYTPGACLNGNYFSSGSNLGATCASPGDAYWSGGIDLISQPSTVNVSSNVLSDNQVGIWNTGGPAAIWNNHVGGSYVGIVDDFNLTDVGGIASVLATLPFTDVVGANTIDDANVGVLVFDDNATVEGNSATNVNVSYEVETTTGATFTDSLVDNTASANVSGALLGNASAFDPVDHSSLTGVFTVSGNDFTNASTGGPSLGGIVLTGASATVNNNVVTGFSNGLSAVVGPTGAVAAQGNTVVGPSTAVPGFGAYVFADTATVTGNHVANYSWMNGAGWWPNSQSTGLFVQCLSTCGVESNSLLNDAIGIGVVSYAYGPSPAPAWPFAATPSQGPITVAHNTVVNSGAFGIAFELNQETSSDVTTPTVSVTQNTVNNTLTGAVGLMVDQGTYGIGDNVFVGTSTSGTSGASQPTGEGSIGTAAIQVLDADDSETDATLGGDLFLDTSVPLSVLNVTTAPPYEVVLHGNVVTFSETGLPTGTTWSVTAGGATFTSSSATITIDLGPGSQGYAPGAVAGYFTPASSSVSVGLVAQTVAVTYVASYTVTFTESGLPGGTSWSVTLGAASSSSTSTTNGFLEANGSYAYTVGLVAGWHLTHESGSVLVAGAPVGVHLSFLRTTYHFQFVESGLPAGTSWGAKINGHTVLSGTTTTLSTFEPNGTYSWVLSDVGGYRAVETGSVVLNGGGATVFVHFTPKTWLALFTEKHLPTGTSWSVSVNAGTPVSGTTATLQDQLVNGSYSFVLGAVSGWNSTTERGTFSIAGGPTHVSIVFSQVVYKVTFSETGLPHGTNWQVKMPGVTHVATFSTITFLEPNGSFAFSVASTGYTATPSSGSIVVSAGPASQGVVFS